MGRCWWVWDPGVGMVHLGVGCVCGRLDGLVFIDVCVYGGGHRLLPGQKELAMSVGLEALTLGLFT